MEDVGSFDFDTAGVASFAAVGTSRSCPCKMLDVLAGKIYFSFIFLSPKCDRFDIS
jgi:hypothetical protein